MSDRTRGQGALFFIAAHELGHVHLGHTRRLFQLEKLKQLMFSGVTFVGLGHSDLEKAIDERIVSLGNYLTFRYSPGEELEADRFALELCKFSSVDPENGLDTLRWLYLLEQENTDKRSPKRPPLRQHPDTLYRLKVLLEMRREQSWGQAIAHLLGFRLETNR